MGWWRSCRRVRSGFCLNLRSLQGVRHLLWLYNLSWGGRLRRMIPNIRNSRNTTRTNLFSPPSSLSGTTTTGAGALAGHYHWWCPRCRRRGKLQCHMKHMKSRYIRTSETSETPMTAMCRDMMLMKFNLFLGQHHMMGDVEVG